MLFIRLQNIIDSQNPLMFHVKLLTYSPFCHPLIIHICLFVVRSLRVTNKNIMAVSSCFLVALCNIYVFTDWNIYLFCENSTFLCYRQHRIIQIL